MTASLSTSVILSSLSLYYGDELTGLLETARMADDLGIGQLVLTDHVVMGERTVRYPYGRFPYTLEEPWPEPLSTLAALAGCTRRARESPESVSAWANISETTGEEISHLNVPKTVSPF